MQLQARDFSLPGHIWSIVMVKKSTDSRRGRKRERKKESVERSKSKSAEAARTGSPQDSTDITRLPACLGRRLYRDPRKRGSGPCRGIFDQVSPVRVVHRPIVSYHVRESGRMFAGIRATIVRPLFQASHIGVDSQISRGIAR